jgi:thiol-disulfide isomerase/thioredoxin
MFSRCLLAACLIFGATAIRAEEPATAEQPAAEPSYGQRLVDSVGESPKQHIYPLTYEAEPKLRQSGEEAEKIAAELLAVLPQIVKDPAAVGFIESLGKKKPAVAATLLLHVARAGEMIKGRDGAAIVVGQLVVEDGKVDPVNVFAQMPILEEGYFAGEIGDRKRPLNFRAHGYEDAVVTLAAEDGGYTGEAGGVIVLDKVEMRPVAPERQASLRGRVVLDAASDGSTATLMLHTAMPDVNTTSGGYSGRMGWPEGIKVEVDESGAFTADGLNPSKYNIMASAEGHVTKFEPVVLAAGDTHDAGDVRLFSSDLDFYIGQEAPETPELAWEADYKAALERSKNESRPLMVMMTATWCGPCKLLEQETLADPWIRHFLASFVVVKAYEDRDVEKTHGLQGYPTLVFCDSSGKQVHKTVGYQPAFAFASQCAKAYKGLNTELPAELQLLIEKKIVAVE